MTVERRSLDWPQARAAAAASAPGVSNLPPSGPTPTKSVSQKVQSAVARSSSRPDQRLHPEKRRNTAGRRSEEHTSELQSLLRISYAVIFLKNKHQAFTPQNMSSQRKAPSARTLN